MNLQTNGVIKKMKEYKSRAPKHICRKKENNSTIELAVCLILGIPLLLITIFICLCVAYKN
jgi:hypothetical protein